MAIDGQLFDSAAHNGQRCDIPKIRCCIVATRRPAASANHMDSRHLARRISAGEGEGLQVDNSRRDARMARNRCAMLTATQTADCAIMYDIICSGLAGRCLDMSVARLFSHRQTALAKSAARSSNPNQLCAHCPVGSNGNFCHISRDGESVGSTSNWSCATATDCESGPDCRGQVS